MKRHEKQGTSCVFRYKISFFLFSLALPLRTKGHFLRSNWKSLNRKHFVKKG